MHKKNKNDVCDYCGLPHQFFSKYPLCSSVEKGNWIKVSTKLPSSTDAVLVVVKDTDFWTCAMIGEYNSKGWNFKDKRKWRIVDLWGWDGNENKYQFVDSPVTHWMPLPYIPRKVPRRLKKKSK